MAPSLKDSDTQTTSESPSRNGSAASTDSPVKQQPVALEIPITVNGARTAEGGDKREPFSESTKTVMVFGSGAIIRLNSSLAPGQLLFVTNERSKKEVVCQVVKSKNCRNVNGYVELEFTEPAAGFWGMRFLGDRIGPGPQAAGETGSTVAGDGSPAPSRPVEEKVHQPAASSSSTVAAKPSTPAPVSSKPSPSAASGSSIVPAALDSATLLGNTKSKPESGVPAAPVATSLGADEPLVEPWLKKRAPVTKPVAAQASLVSPEPTAKAEEPEENLPTPKFELTRPSDKPASLFAPAEPSAPLSGVDLSSLTPFFEVKPDPGEGAMASPKTAATSDSHAEDDAEELKHHTARLQQELSQMQFAEPATESPANPQGEAASVSQEEASAALVKADPVDQSAARLVNDSEAPSTAPLLPEPPGREESSKKAPSPVIPALEALEHEELKIPAWLEPLARNASAPTQELVLREKTKRIAEQPPLRELVAPLAAPFKKEEPVAESRVARFGSALPFDEGKKAKESSAKKSGKGMLFVGLAAGIVVLAGGGWRYMKQQAAGVHDSPSAYETSAATATLQDLQTDSTKEAAMGAMLPAPGDPATSRANAAAANSAPTNTPVTAANNPQAATNSTNSGNSVILADSTPTEAELAAEKKPVLGEVHLARPEISQKRPAQNGAETDATIAINEEPPEGGDDSLGSGLGTKQPTAPEAPAAIGGDVQQAKLISSVPPVYPELAKAQHISGGVTIDALIGADGRVTKMNVISGPTLLQQAAMGALKQWKYQPATLDGKAVPMHLTVTIQFRLQE